MYSQHDEEKVILDWFGDKAGRFLDIGAYDGERFSNIRKLTELGWAGVCVEPSPAAFVKLMQCHKGNSQVELVSAAVCTRAEVRRFYACDGAASTFLKPHRNLWRDSKLSIQYQTIYVSVLSPLDLFDLFGWRYDFVNIDTEGESVELFCSLDLGKIGASLVCVEHDDQPDRVIQAGASYGYREVHRVGPNILLGKKEK